MPPTLRSYRQSLTSAVSCVLCALTAALVFCPAPAGASEPIKLKRSDTFELVRGLDHDTIYTFGSVRFEQDNSRLECDSAIWVKGSRLYLWGNALFDDGRQLLRADSIVYELTDSTLYAVGDSVVLISFVDSIRAVGSELFYSRESDELELLGQPRVRFGYPDSSRVREVRGSYIRYNYQTREAAAQSEVEMFDGQSRAFADCALFDRNPERIRLYDNAQVFWENHQLAGDFITMISENGEPQQVEVWGGGVAVFREVSVADSLDSDTAVADSSKPGLDSLAPTPESASSGTGVSRLTGQHLRFYFEDGELREVEAHGKAFSHYQPTSVDNRTYLVNRASGDSIKMYLEADSLRTVNVFGSVEGEYTERKEPLDYISDSLAISQTDTVRYSGEQVHFDMQDSSITLSGSAAVHEKVMHLQADSIFYETAERFVRAFALEPPAADTDSMFDTLVVDSTVDSASPIPLDIPSGQPLGRVVLNDGGQEVEGTYVEYSMVTNKGVLRQSATQYDRAYYTGGELYRETPDVYFVDRGSYTTCEFDSPHFHFWSKEMKVVNDDKMIAKPVVFYIEKIPLFVIPYYVFPMRDGRRSGILNFRFGNFNQGGRFIRDVGYYWAASEYWDYEGWMDYYETTGLTLSSALRYAKRYKFSGDVRGSYSWDSDFDNTFSEVKTKRWRMSFNHRQTIDPTFSVNASGSFLSDSRYLTDFSSNLSDRLNRKLRSQVNFSKRFGGASMSGSYIYDNDLDNEITTRRYPNLSFRAPSFGLFGSPARGGESRWYHTFRMAYNSRLNHFSDTRNKFTTLVEPDTLITIISADTTVDTTFDTLGAPIAFDTTVNVTSADSTFLDLDVDTSRTSKAYTTYTHSTGLGPNFTVLGYFPMRLSVSYSETLFKISETDQSRGVVNTAKVFRTYSTSFNASLNTKLYGTVRPNILGLTGLRHELSPSASYSFRPTIAFDQETREAAAFAGVGAGSSNSQSINFGLGNTFQAKIGSDESERVITLLTMSSGISYNPEATERRWSNMVTSFSTNIARRIQLSGGMTHSFYADGGLQDFNIRTAFSTSGDFGKFYAPGEKLIRDTGRSEIPQSGYGAGESRAWSLRLNHYYAENDFSKSHFMNISANLQLTRNMSMDFTQRYDFIRRVTVNRHINIRRRLHCWEGVFSWTPTGSNQGYFFKINVIDLPDIKFEKSLNSVRGRGVLGF